MEKDISLSTRILALFDKRIEGDDALWHLARLRFKEAGLGTEFYAEAPEHLDWLLTFKPSLDTPAAVHLPRELDLFNSENRRLIVEFAQIFNKRLYALIVHDQPEARSRFDEYLAVLVEMGSEFRKMKGSPHLFVEYASGLEPDLFIALFRRLRETDGISACIDTGHIGLWQVKTHYSKIHPGKDIFALNSRHTELPGVIGDVQTAVESALDVVLHIISELGSLGKPLHFHLHDGHPLSSNSPYGVSDHLSFLTEIPLPFEYKGKNSVHTMFGPAGLRKIAGQSLTALDPGLVSFSLEIHPTEGRIPLGEASYLFNHWSNKTNAERMNFWLSVLAQNHLLLSEILSSWNVCISFPAHGILRTCLSSEVELGMPPGSCA